MAFFPYLMLFVLYIILPGLAVHDPTFRYQVWKVNVLVGTKNGGNVSPGASLPFSMAKPGPDWIDGEFRDPDMKSKRRANSPA